MPGSRVEAAAQCGPGFDRQQTGTLARNHASQPRLYGKAQSTWTLKLLAEVCQEQGLSETVLSAPTLLDAVMRLGSRWKRAKQWIVSPDPLYVLKKQRAQMMRYGQSHEAFAYGFADEVWWSRTAQPALHSWCHDQLLRLVEQPRANADPDGPAVACYGCYLPIDNQMLLRFVDGRPVSAVTCTFLAWLAERFTANGKRALFLIWDNATWHTSRCVRTWLKAYNRLAKQQGACRLIICHLPSKSPWLNPIEPKWLHGKPAIAEPVRTLSIDELIQRICGYYHCERLDSIAK